MPEIEFRIEGLRPGERVLGEGDELDQEQDLGEVNPLDSEPARKVHRQLMSWYYREREVQADNRLEMSIDADFYDGDQWDVEDAAALEERGQAPLVFNEIAPMVDWLIGTERRTRVDWRVLARTPEAVDLADIKTKVLKYVADVNRAAFNRSRAFEDAVKVGVGWVDDGVRNDQTKDPLYSKYEDWRNVLWDSMATELDLSDARYIFRTRWVDEDVAVAMYPDRADVIQKAVEEADQYSSQRWEEDEFYYSGNSTPTHVSDTSHVGGGRGVADAEPRRRVRIIECQFRIPVEANVVTDGAFRGAFMEEWDRVLLNQIQQQGGSIVERNVMRMHIAVMTEGKLLALGPMPMRHNSFSLTPIWCYRRGRDRMPYGVVRRVRDIQMDLNKRASKALHVLSTNQIIVDEGAVDDINETREEADRPDGVLIVKPGKRLELHRDSEMATGHIQLMSLGAQAIQKSAGVSNENLGRQTNASSGEAIKARQMQGSVVTTQPFDNLRLAVQVQGEKMLSLIEQWYTEEKAVRLSGHKGQVEWTQVNVPELQPDGSVRFLNDITSSLADFVVNEQDYAGTIRQVMMESLTQMAQRLPPELAIRLLTIAMDYSDLPNREAIADEMRKLTGERDPNKELTPEEEQQMAMQAQLQAEAMQMQQEQARQALAEQVAKVREINARAAKLEAEADDIRRAGDGEQADHVEGAAAQARRDADEELTRVRDELAKARADAERAIAQARSDRDLQIELARINADSRERVAEIQASSRQRLGDVSETLSSLGADVPSGDLTTQEVQ